MKYKCKDIDNILDVTLEKSKDAKTIIVKAKTGSNEKLYGEFLFAKLKGSLKSDDYFETNSKPKVKVPEGAEKILTMGIIGRKEYPNMHTLYLKPRGRDYGEVLYMKENDYKEMLDFMSSEKVS